MRRSVFSKWKVGGLGIGERSGNVIMGYPAYRSSELNSLRACKSFPMLVFRILLDGMFHLAYCWSLLMEYLIITEQRTGMIL